MIKPTTNLKLIKCNLEIDNYNQINFQNATLQYNYFNSLSHIDVEDFTYQRKDSVIRYGACIDDLWEYNYVMYQNEAYGDKWFYAYITNMVWLNDNVTAISIKTDVFQTWQFDLIYKPSFIEREHVNDDTIGLHTVPENLETGEYIIQRVPIQANYGNFYSCVAITEDILLENPPYNNHYYNKIISGFTYLALKTSADIRNFLLLYSNSSKLEAIQAMFMIPESFLEKTEWRTDKTGTINFKYVPEVDESFNMGSVTIQKPIILGEAPTGYTPINNKCLVYPFCYLLVDNNAGATNIYQYELFSPIEGSSYRVIKFKIKGTIDIGCSIKSIPINYKFAGENYIESLNGAKLPVGSWVGDYFTNWVTQNGINIATSLVGAGVQIRSSYHNVSSKAPVVDAPSIATGLINIADTLGAVYERSKIPEVVYGNVNASNISFTVNKISPSFYQMSIKTEYAKIIDDFFSMYGYKVNTLKIPNIMGRKNWNYIKTIGVNIEAYIPQNDLQEIKNMFNNGITLWHNPATFLDYSQDNTII